MWHAEEGLQGQGHWFGDTFYSQIAINRGYLITIKFHAGGFEGDGWVLGGIEEVLILQMGVEQRETAINGGSVNHYINATSLGSAVYGDLARGFVEAAQLGGIAKVAVFKAWHAVVGVDHIGFRRCQNSR